MSWSQNGKRAASGSSERISCTALTLFAFKACMSRGTSATAFGGGGGDPAKGQYESFRGVEGGVIFSLLLVIRGVVGGVISTIVGTFIEAFAATAVSPHSGEDDLSSTKGVTHNWNGRLPKFICDPVGRAGSSKSMNGLRAAEPNFRISPNPPLGKWKEPRAAPGLGEHQGESISLPAQGLGAAVETSSSKVYFLAGFFCGVVNVKSIESNLHF